MGKQVSLTVPDEVMRRAEVLAGHSGRAVAEVLTDAIEASLDPLSFTSSATDAIGELSDAQVLELADSTMAPADDRRLSELLARKNEGVLLMPERDELTPLMQSYQEGLLRKAQAIREAVRRGLRPSPAP
jgi:predicted DNA-binding protein